MLSQGNLNQPDVALCFKFIIIGGLGSQTKTFVVGFCVIGFFPTVIGGTVPRRFLLQAGSIHLSLHVCSWFVRLGCYCGDVSNFNALTPLAKKFVGLERGH
jgi:hypothetical protein